MKIILIKWILELYKAKQCLIQNISFLILENISRIHYVFPTLLVALLQIIHTDIYHEVQSFILKYQKFTSQIKEHTYLAF